MRHWFKRLADVPHVNYPGHPTIDRTRLKDHDLEARRSVWKDSDGKRKESLIWERGDSSGSSSPAFNHWMNFENRHIPSTPQETIQRAFESLELPGTINDYHQTLESVASSLWNQRKAEPQLLKAIEHYCWQDVRLVEAYPGLYDHLNLGFAPRLSCFDHLVKLYEREGFWNDALAVVRRAQKLTSHQDYADRIFEISGRLNQLAADGI